MIHVAGKRVVSRGVLAAVWVTLAWVPGGAPGAAPDTHHASQNAPQEIVVHVSELPRRALSEFRFWDDPASPGGRLVGYPNTGEELDPPPENDPHVTFAVPVRQGVPYRCWVHMKVGEAGGVSQANMVWVQFTDAVNAAGDEVLAPRSRSYLTARGPTEQGWAWVSCDSELPGLDRLVRFATTGEVTVRVQAGMEGVGFDQFILSPSRYLEDAPSEAVVPKSG